MHFRFFKAAVAAAAAGCATVSQAATIMVDSTSQDSVGQSIVYNLRNQIAKSSLHKIVYSKADAGFVISIVTLKETDGVSVYSAALLVPPFDKKGWDYYITSQVGYCGSTVTESCASRILSGFDQDMTDVSAAIMNVVKKPQ